MFIYATALSRLFFDEARAEMIIFRQMMPMPAADDFLSFAERLRRFYAAP